ncbi:MAG TPA: ferritin family protein [Anaerolineae bacterium]|nr:ferritin family protein [Anaerolineae bacterium]
MELRKIYEYALQREHEGRDFFAGHATRMGHAAAAAAFEALAEEERNHIKFIQSLIDALDAGEASPLAGGEAMEREGFFSSRAEAEMLDQTIIEAMVPDLAVLRTAYLIERDFAEYYEASASRMESAGNADAFQALGMLARWERQHEQLFKTLHDRAYEEYASMPWGG